MVLLRQIIINVFLENELSCTYTLCPYYLLQITYDTLVEKVDAPTIFVATKDSQAYPKYWLTVKKV